MASGADSWGIGEGFVRTHDDGVLLTFSTWMLEGRAADLAWEAAPLGKRSLLRVNVHLRGIQPSFRLDSDFLRTFPPSDVPPSGIATIFFEHHLSYFAQTDSILRGILGSSSVL